MNHRSNFPLISYELHQLLLQTLIHFRSMCMVYDWSILKTILELNHKAENGSKRFTDLYRIWQWSLDALYVIAAFSNSQVRQNKNQKQSLLRKLRTVMHKAINHIVYDIYSLTVAFYLMTYYCNTLLSFW